MENKDTQAESIDQPVKDITIKLEQATPEETYTCCPGPTSTSIQEPQTVDVKHEVEIPEPDWSKTEIKWEGSIDEDKEKYADFPWQVYKDGELIRHVWDVGTGQNPSSTGRSNVKTDIGSCFAVEHSASVKMIMFEQTMETNNVNSGINSSSTGEQVVKPETSVEGTLSEVDQLFYCELCEFSSNDQHLLVRHMRNHTREIRHICSICQYSATRKYNLIEHTRIHTGEKPFKCTLCEYRTRQRSHLLTHMRTHTGEKPFKCTLCEYRSKQKGTLTVHMRIHTGDKPFKCTLCEYRCTDKKSLTRHMRTHTCKLFKCIVCEYKCNLRSNMARHVRSHIGD